MTTSFRTGALSCALLATTCLVAPAAAQTEPPLPMFRTIDENGVDLTTGEYNFQIVEGSIGAGEQALSLVRTWNGRRWTDNWTGILRKQTTNGITEVTVDFGAISDRFVLSGSTYVSNKADGATLVEMPGGLFRYTAADGTGIEYQAEDNDGYRLRGPGCNSSSGRSCGIPISITKPNGAQFTLEWDLAQACDEDGEGDCPNGQSFYRWIGVVGPTGNRIAINYVSDDPGYLVPDDEWFERAGAQFFDPSENCSSSCPSVVYDESFNVMSVTDAANRTWQFNLASSARLTGIKRPGDSGNSIQIAYDGNHAVSSVTRDGVATTYSRVVSSSGSTATMTVTDALNNQTIVISDLAKGRPTSVEDPLDRTTTYAYDSNGRLTQVAAPEGNKAIYTYDARGNVLTTRRRDEANNPANDIVTSAAYPSSCANPKTCNKPTSTTDAAGYVTDYSYNSTHGQVTSVTLPAAPNGIRPQTRFSYSAVNGVHLLSSISACQTLASCAGTADEAKTVIAYNAALLPNAVTSGDGTGALAATRAMTYDAIGNLQTIDGPLAGTADTTRYRYNAARELVGVIGPDPDGAGVLKHRATRIDYNGAGQVETVERGTVASQSDADWSQFAGLESLVSTYDEYGRRSFDELMAGSTVHVRTQYSYDALGRVQCRVARMNVDPLAPIPVSACTLGPEGSFGPDRITRTSYDAAGQLVEVREALWTADEANVAVYLYTDNGKVAHAIDGEGNATGYGYDGHDRLNRIVYPSPTVPGDTNPADDELFTYDARGNIVSRQLRDDQTITYFYDNLSRLVSKDVPNLAYYENDVAYSYDLLGRLTQAASGGVSQTVARSYDALGRVVSETSLYGTKAMHYDIAGRMTQMTWPDGFHVTYDYNVAGEMTAIRENGSALLASFGYDDLGRRTSLTRGNGTSTSYAYDAVSRLSQQVENLGGMSHDLTLAFAYNPANQIVSRTANNDVYAWTGHSNTSVADTHNGLNQLVTTGGASVSHDLRGNTTAIGSTSFGYTSENRMTNGAGTWFVHDALGRLTDIYPSPAAEARIDNLGTMLISELDNSNNITRRYVHGPGVDEPLVEYSGAGLAQKRWLHADERGSIVGWTDASGTSIQTNRYDDYGKPQAGHSGRFGYTGQAWIPEIGLYYYKARMYNPDTGNGGGRFPQADPLGWLAGPNPYNYAGGDPINRIDPTGLWETCFNVAGPSRMEDGLITVTWRRICVNADSGGGSSGGGGRGGGGSDGGTVNWPRDPCAAQVPYKSPCTPPPPPPPPSDPNPDPRRDACGKPLPPASRNYSVPPGYTGGFHDQNRYVYDSTGKLVNNPYFQTVWDSSIDINWSGVGRDLGLIVGGVGVALRKGAIVALSAAGLIPGSAGAKTGYELVFGKNSQCSR